MPPSLAAAGVEGVRLMWRRIEWGTSAFIAGHGAARLPFFFNEYKRQSYKRLV